MIKNLKDGGMVVIDKSHKAIYHTPISCMEYFNSFSLMGFTFSVLPIYLLVNHTIYNYKHII